VYVANAVFTDRELDVMSVLWEEGPSTVAEVRGRLADPLAYTTVLTVLRTLEDKGHVAHVEEGRAFRYRALVEQGEARVSALARLRRKLFDGSAKLLVTELVADRSLSRKDLEGLRELLEQRLGKKE
jgi:BlaI family transcriptional regulator, penicillinase repressor